MNHVWRTVQRQHLGGYNGSDQWQVDCDHPEFKLMAENDHDAILLVKQSMASMHLSQPPTVCLPAAALSKVDPAALTVAPRNLLSGRQLKEFKKTADAVGKEPWRMFGARDYLNAWVEANQADQHDHEKPIALKFLFERRINRDHSEQNVDRSNLGYDYAPGPPRSITFGTIAAKEMAKRLEPRKRVRVKGPETGAPCPPATPVPDDTLEEAPAPESEEPTQGATLKRPRGGRRGGRGRGRGRAARVAPVAEGPAAEEPEAPDEPPPPKRVRGSGRDRALVEDVLAAAEPVAPEPPRPRRVRGRGRGRGLRLAPVEGAPLASPVAAAEPEATEVPPTPAVQKAIPEGDQPLGCSKCRYVLTGCGVCKARQKAGFKWPIPIIAVNALPVPVPNLDFIQPQHS